MMLASGISLGVQRLLLDLGQAWVLNALLIAAFVACLMVTWSGRQFAPWALRSIARATLVLVLVRFAAPCYALLSEGVFQTVLSPTYTSASEKLRDTGKELAETGRHIDKDEDDATTSGGTTTADDKPQEAASGIATWWERMWRTVSATIEPADIHRRIDRYRELAESASRDIIELAVVFVVQSVLLPLIFLWALMQLFRRTIRESAATQFSSALWPAPKVQDLSALAQMPDSRDAARRLAGGRVARALV